MLGIRVEGLSVGGIETCIDLPDWRLAFDIGRTPEFSIARDTILFTHAHVDHMGGVVAHCATRALRALPPPRYVVGPEHADAFRDLFEVWRRLDRSHLPHELIVASPGDAIELGTRRRALPVRAVHRAPCQGYAIVERRPRLATRLRGSEQGEIDAARVRGEEITEDEDRVLFAFSGDTTIEMIEREPLMRRARVLVLECTFLDERVPPAKARAMGHVHLDDVIGHAELFENEALVLSHLSSRHGLDEARGILGRRLPPSLRGRVHLLGADGHV